MRYVALRAEGAVCRAYPRRLATTASTSCCSRTRRAKSRCICTHLHAQKDLKEEVENAHSLSIKATRSVSVGGNETYTISGKRTKSIGGKDEKGEGIEIHGDRSTTISKNETFSVTEHQKHTIGKGREAGTPVVPGSSESSGAGTTTAGTSRTPSGSVAAGFVPSRSRQ
ncbi:MAG: hypothetical protein RLZZ450_6361 [Pseudomonadota bacterium]